MENSTIFSELKKARVDVDISLERFSYDEELYLKHAMKFPEEKSIERLRKAVEDKDYVEAEHAVHAMKGIAQNLGFTDLADATVDMLEELRDGDNDAALEAYDDVEEQYGKLCAVIKKIRE